MLPVTPFDIDPSWLTAALAESGFATAVDRIAVDRVVDATNVNAVLSIGHDGADAFPGRVFVKMPPRDPERRARLDWLSMARREVRFFRELRPRLAVKTPTVFVAELSEQPAGFVLVVELLGTAGTRLPDLVGGLDPALLDSALTDLAGLHARFEDPAVRATEAPWLERSSRSSDYGARLLRAGIDGGARLSSPFVAVAERYLADRDLLQDAWELGPMTVLHGDAHIGNVYVDDRAGTPQLGLFDWGLMTVGSPLRDVSYLISMTLSPADRRANERALLGRYLAARDRAGATPIAADDAWFWHRLHAAYTVVASCQSIVARPSDGPGRRAFSAAFVDRAEQAVADLESLDAIEEFARR